MRAKSPSPASRDAENTKERARHARSGLVLSSLLLVVPLVAGCSDAATQDFCTQYEDLVAAAEELRATDPVTADVEELRAAADDVSDELDQFQAVSEGRLDDALTRLRERVDEVRQAAVAEAEALEAARPLIQEDLAQVESAWLAVQDLVETQCPAEG
ncbi:MAG: hypothetical protein WCA30_09905 [Dermatophilaceae bacterium]